MNNLDCDTKVCELIEYDLSCCKNDLILACFDPHDAHHILNIPLSSRRPKDEILWHCEKNGCYSVRSAYHGLQHDLLCKKPGPSSSHSQRLWKIMWNSNQQPRVRNFIWRLGKEILPTSVNLQKKGIMLDTTCSFCGEFPESASHLFMHCEYSRLTFFPPSWFQATL